MSLPFPSAQSSQSSLSPPLPKPRERVWSGGRLAGLAIAIAAGCLMASAPASAQDAVDLHGQWFGLFDPEAGGELDVEIIITDEVGLFGVRGRRLDSFGNGVCRYVFAVAATDITSMSLNPSNSSGTNCIEQPGFALERESADQLRVAFDADTSAWLAGVPSVVLDGLQRPLREGDRRVAVPGFDILGVAPGTDRAAVELALSSAGYERAGERNRRTSSSLAGVSEHWRREQASNARFMDNLSLTFSYQEEGVTGQDSLVAITRVHQPTEAISVAALEQALNEKYGEAEFGNLRQYRRDGSLSTISTGPACGLGPHQEFEFEHWIYTSTSPSTSHEDVRIYCGAKVAISMLSDHNTGAVSEYRIGLFDTDVLWQDHWREWSHMISTELISELNALQSLSGTAPKL